MKEKDLKHLSRRELLEMLVELSRENDALRQQLDLAQSQLKDRRIRLERCDNLTQASMELNGVYDALKNACDQYLETLRLQQEESDAYWNEAEKESGV